LNQAVFSSRIISDGKWITSAELLPRGREARSYPMKWTGYSRDALVIPSDLVIVRAGLEFAVRDPLPKPYGHVAHPNLAAHGAL
jgi:hypothetical protein